MGMKDEIKAAENLHRLLCRKIPDITITIQFKETGRRAADNSNLQPDKPEDTNNNDSRLTQEELKEFRKTIRRINHERSRSGRPRLRYSMKIEDKTYQSRSSMTSIPS